MSLVKAKQIDINDLSNSLVTLIMSNPAIKAQWGQILNNTFISYVFSLANSNISLGQTVFSPCEPFRATPAPSLQPPPPPPPGMR